MAFHSRKVDPSKRTNNAEQKAGSNSFLSVELSIMSRPMRHYFITQKRTIVRRPSKQPIG